MSIYDISLSTANRWYNVGWFVSIAGAVFTVFAVMVLFWTSAVRDRYSDQSIAGANAKGEQAKLEAAKANERSSKLEFDAAHARERTAQVELQLERERAERVAMQSALGPRTIPFTSKEVLASHLSGKNLTLQLTVLGDAEASQYANQIGHALESAGVALQVQRVGMMLPLVYGVILRGNGQDFEDMAKSFEAANIPFVSQQGPQLGMIVGLKPIYQPNP